MALTIEEIKERLTQRTDPDLLVSILEPEIEQFVEACHELIIEKEKEILVYLEETNL